MEHSQEITFCLHIFIQFGMLFLNKRRVAWRLFVATEQVETRTSREVGEVCIDWQHALKVGRSKRKGID